MDHFMSTNGGSTLALLTAFALLTGCGDGDSDTNLPPTASFTVSPATGVAPLSVQFDASMSADTGGSIVSYSWDFGDGLANGSGVKCQSHLPPRWRLCCEAYRY
jgi:PKD repeat protein